MLFTFSGCGVHYMYGSVFVLVHENPWRRMKTTGPPHFYVRMIWKVAQDVYVASSYTVARKKNREKRFLVPYVRLHTKKITCFSGKSMRGWGFFWTLKIQNQGVFDIASNWKACMRMCEARYVNWAWDWIWRLLPEKCRPTAKKGPCGVENPMRACLRIICVTFFLCVWLSVKLPVEHDGEA